jgi:hypothetical protein
MSGFATFNVDEFNALFELVNQQDVRGAVRLLQNSPNKIALLDNRVEVEGQEMTVVYFARRKFPSSPMAKYMNETRFSTSVSQTTTNGLEPEFYKLLGFVKANKRSEAIQLLRDSSNPLALLKKHKKFGAGQSMTIIEFARRESRHDLARALERVKLACNGKY